MQRARVALMMVLIAFVMAAVIPMAAMAAEPVTIQGEVNDSYQIVDSNGQVYEVADTTQGNELVENHIGEKAKVVGTVEMNQDIKTITVTKFEILAE